MNYCSHCGQPVVYKVPPGDNLSRAVCESCERVHYVNPNMVVGCVAEWEGRILLCKRSIEPRRGYWTIPAGFLENGETLEAGAAREAREEALAEVDIGSLLAIVNVPHAHQVHIMFRAGLVGGEFGVGDESEDARLYDEADIPWPDIAFPSVEVALRRYLEDRAGSREDVHLTAVSRVRL